MPQHRPGHDLPWLRDPDRRRSLDRVSHVTSLIDALWLELYDELVIAIRCSRLFTGERFSAGPATVLLDGEKIVGVESWDVELDESWKVYDYPSATVLPGLIDTHVHLVADSEVGALDRVPGLAPMHWTRSSLKACGNNWPRA